MTTNSHSLLATRGPQDGVIVIAGAGVVGLTLAIALSQAGSKVVVVAPVPPARPGRTVALLDGSVRLLKQIGVWPQLAGRTAPLATMRIVDDTPSLFRRPPLDFRAAELGIEAFGHNIENADLEAALAARAAQCQDLVRHEALLASWVADADRLTVTASDGRRFQSSLLVAADGARSMIRRQAGIGIREKTYPQAALTAILHHEQPHRDISTEFHTREGPFTLVPLPGTPDAPHRSSLVWVMTPARADALNEGPRADLAAAIERRARTLLGSVEIHGETGLFPIRRLVAKRLTAGRTVLIGEAAHALPPIGAQGLNLSLRDVETLASILAAARSGGTDPGSAELLARYERAREGEVAVRVAGVDMLNSALLAGTLSTDLLRGAGMAALARIAPLRRAMMRQGLMAPGARVG